MKNINAELLELAQIGIEKKTEDVYVFGFGFEMDENEEICFVRYGEEFDDGYHQQLSPEFFPIKRVVWSGPEYGYNLIVKTIKNTQFFSGRTWELVAKNGDPVRVEII